MMKLIMKPMMRKMYATMNLVISKRTDLPWQSYTNSKMGTT